MGKLTTGSQFQPTAFLAQFSRY